MTAHTHLVVLPSTLDWDPRSLRPSVSLLKTPSAGPPVFSVPLRASDSIASILETKLGGMPDVSRSVSDPYSLPS